MQQLSYALQIVRRFHLFLASCDARARTRNIEGGLGTGKFTSEERGISGRVHQRGRCAEQSQRSRSSEIEFGSWHCDIGDFWNQKMYSLYLGYHQEFVAISILLVAIHSQYQLFLWKIVGAWWAPASNKEEWHISRKLNNCGGQYPETYSDWPKMLDGQMHTLMSNMIHGLLATNEYLVLKRQKVWVWAFCFCRKTKVH